MPYTPFSVCIRPLEEDETQEELRRHHQGNNMGNCLVSKKTKARDNKQTITGGGGNGGGRSNQSRGSTAGLTVTNVNAKEYSWSNRERKDLSRYIIENLNDSVEIRLAGEVDGEQFIIQNCCRSTIALYDYSNTVMIDDCTDCTFFIGPVMGSIAIRNSENCRLMSASQQFRTRDCKRLDLFLFCGTQPAIESCSQLRFGCFSANYNGLKDQFSKAGLDVFNNKWSQVYDFSIDDQERHWSTFPADVKATDFFRAVLMGNPMLNLSFNVNSSLVPQTLGVVSLEFTHSRAIGMDFYANNGSFDSASASANQQTISSIEEGEGGGSRDDSASNARLCLVFVYAYDEDGTIELETQRLLQEIAIKHKEATLLMTKSFQPEQASLKLALIAAEDAMCGRPQAENKNNRNSHNSTNVSLLGTAEGSAPNKSTSSGPLNRLLVLFYQGSEHLRKTLYDSCTHVFGSSSAASSSSSASFKLVSDDDEETVFGHYLAIAFENLISY